LEINQTLILDEKAIASMNFWRCYSVNESINMAHEGCIYPLTQKNYAH